MLPQEAERVILIKLFGGLDLKLDKVKANGSEESVTQFQQLFAR